MRNVLAAIISVLCMTGCTSSSKLPSLTVSPERALYRLGFGDELKVTVYGEEKLSGTFQVSGQGNVAFPLVGDIPAAGKTIQEFNADLARELSDGLVKKPNISIQVANYRPFYVLGEVNKPGQYAYSEGLTVFNAVAIAGGFSYRADQKRIRISHKGDNKETLYRLDAATPVQPGDTIRVVDKMF